MKSKTKLCKECGANLHKIVCEHCPDFMKSSEDCTHQYNDGRGSCLVCGASVSSSGAIYNPRVHKKLTCDKVISVVHGKELVGVYWKGTSGASVLFETSPEKAKQIINIFNGVKPKVGGECYQCGNVLVDKRCPLGC